MSSSTTTTNDDSIESSENVAASGQILREDWDMIGRMIDSLSDETRVRVYNDGMQVSVVDAGNAAMLDLHVTPDQWQCGQAETVGMKNCQGILKPMKVAKEMGEDTVDVTIMTDSVDYGVMSVDMVDPDSIRRMPDLPDVEYDVQATISLIDLKEWINAASDYDTVWIKQDGFDLTFECNGDVTTMSKTFSNVCESAGDSETLMSMEYLYDVINSMLKGHAKKFNAVLSWSDEFPLRIAFSHRSNDHRRDESDIAGMYVQAPRVQGDN